jgi:hypothetical protein
LFFLLLHHTLLQIRSFSRTPHSAEGVRPKEGRGAGLAADGTGRKGPCRGGA